MEMQGRGPDTRLVHMTPMELRTLQAMSPTGRLTTNPETGLPEAGILEDILPIALPIAGSFLFPMAAPALFGAGSALAAPAVASAIGTGLGSAASGLVQGKGLGDSLIQGGLSGLMSYGLGSLSSAFAPSGGITSAPSATTADIAGSGLMGGFDPATAAAEATQLTAAQEAAKAAAQQPGFFERLTEPLTKTIAPDMLGGATYGSALGAGGSGLLASGLLEKPYDVADVEMEEYDYYVPDLEAGRKRGAAMARTPTGYYSPSDLLQMATTRGYNPPFLAAEGGPVRLQTGGTATNPYGQPYGPGDAYGAKKYYPESDGEPDVVDVAEYTNIHGPMAGLVSAMTMGLVNSPIGYGSVGTMMGLPGRTMGLTNPIEDLVIGQPNATTPSPMGNVQTYSPDKGLTFAADPTSVAETLGLMSGYGDFAGESTPSMGSFGSYGDEFGESTPSMGSFSDGDVGGVGGDVGGDIGDDYSDIRLKRGVQYLGDVSGLRKYSWNYIWGGPRKVGVMAHELLGTKYADAVRVVDGYMRVDYSQLPAEVRTV